MALPMAANMVEVTTSWRQARFTRAAGLEWASAGDDGVHLRLPCVTGVCNAIGAIDPRAIAAMLDHASSAAIYRLIPAATPIATLALRVAFACAAPVGGALTIHARRPHIAGGVALVEAVACDETDGGLVAQATASFIVGAAPGGVAERSDTDADALQALMHQTAAHFDSFESFVGFLRDGALRLPFTPRLIGAESLPALHGGVVAALLATAGGDLAAAESANRLALLTVQYLRAARAEETRAHAVFDKRGGRANFVSMIATQANGAREVARAQCIFVGGA